MRDKGFTLIELLVVTVIFGIIAAVVSAIFINSQRSKIVTELITEAQQNARIAVDLMAAEIRMAGYGVDWNNEQGGVVYAGPYDIIFNANLNPYPDTTVPAGIPAAMDIDETPGEVPPGGGLYVPAQNYLTGAETIRYTLDYNDNEQIDSGDKENDFARRTRNPNDYLLLKQVYGCDSTSTGSRNGPEVLETAIIGGPDQWPNPSGEFPPLFEYWGDFDSSAPTPDSLWGDSDGDGKLSQAEIQTLTVVPSPHLISKVTINGIGVTRAPAPKEEYQQVKVSTSVSVTRNPNPRKFRLLGHVYLDLDNDQQYDSGEPGLPGFKVTAGPRDFDFSDSTGLYDFLLVPGEYLIRCAENVVGYHLSSPADTTVAVQNRDLDLTEDRHFGMIQDTTGWLAGYVFHDSIPPHDGVWDSASGEMGIPDVKITLVTTGEQRTTDSLPLGYYGFEVVWLRTGTYKVREDNLEGYYSTTPDEVTFVFGDWPPDTTIWINFGDVLFSSEQESVVVRVPNGGEQWQVGETDTIVWHASDLTDGIASADIYLSTTAETSYSLIASVQNSDSSEPWLATYAWTIDTTISTSDFCKIKVIVFDTGGASAFDESDNFFRIYNPATQYAYYFRDSIWVTDTLSNDTVQTFLTVPGDSDQYAFRTTADSGYYRLCFRELPTPDWAVWVDSARTGSVTIPEGDWNFYLWGIVDKVVGSDYHLIGVKVFTYNEGDSPPQTFLFEADGSQPLMTNWIEDTISVARPATTLESGDRLWVEVWTHRVSLLSDSVTVRFGYNNNRVPDPALNSRFTLPGS